MSLFLSIVSVIISIIILYYRTIHYDFVWDDKFFIVNNPIYQNFDMKSMMLTLGNGVEYLPVRDITLSVDYLIAGFNPAIFHGSNIFYYLINVVAVFILSSSLYKYIFTQEQIKYGKVLVPFITAAFFAVHPTHSEAVSFVTCRNVLLSGFFFFISIILFLEWREKNGAHWYLLSIVAFILALLSKATTVTLPLILIILLRISADEKEKKLRVTVPFFLVALLTTGVFIGIANKANVLTENLFDINFTAILTKILIALQIPFFYLFKLVVPMGYTIEYDIPFSASLFSVKTALALVGSVTLIAFGAVFRKRYPAVSLCILWYFITLLPVLNLFPTHPVVADRYAYLPSFAFCFIIAYGIVRITTKHGKWWVIGLTLSILSVWSFTTFKQNKVWENEQTLFENAVKYSPNVNKVLTSLGRIYFHSGQYQKAIALFQRAQALNPYDPHYDYFRGLLAFTLENNVNKALYLFVQSTSRDSDFIEGLYYVGLINERLGDKQQAKQYYQRVIDSKEYDVSSLRCLATQNMLKLERDPKGT